MADSDEEHYTVPLRDQRYFGAGIRRKRVQFVPSAPDTTSASSLEPNAGLTASERYLSIVFGKQRPPSAPPSSSGHTENSLDSTRKSSTDEALDQTAESRPDISNICNICTLPIQSGEHAQRHESSVAHQVCLPHVYPPSALDRTGKGIGILQSYGWDPDQRLGLGAAGEGVLYPVKTNEREKRAGLGLNDDSQERRQKKKRKLEPQKVVKTLDVNAIRKLDASDRKKAERLRQMFYSNDEVDKYLGG